MENALLKELAAKGCAVEEMLGETFTGKEDFYARMLHKLPANKCIGRMRDALAARDAQALFDAAHELKGVYSTLGLTPLWTECCRIVETSRRGSSDGVAEMLDGLETLHGEYVALIGRHG